MASFTAGAYVALGANLGCAQKTLEQAIDALRQEATIEVVAQSRFYRTSPVESSGPDYVNAVVAIRTTLTPFALLAVLQRLEAQFGRVRPAGVHNAPRTLDLDILTYEGVQSDDPTLTLPHPRMTQRLFVLVPLADVAPTWCDEQGRSVQTLIECVRQADPSQSIDVYQPEA